MKKKTFPLGLILVFLLVFGVRLFILSASVWEYLHTEDNCQTIHLPSSQPTVKNQLPNTMIVIKVEPYKVITDRGNMYPGDEYEALGEGAWYGMATLLSVGKNGATFLVNYPVHDPLKGHGVVRKNCKAFLPVGGYSQ